MVDPVAIAKRLRDVAGQDATLVSAALGENILPGTPAAEVWLESGDIERHRASQHESHGEVHSFIVGFFTALTANLSGDEEQIGTLVTTFINRLQDPTFDYSLGGLVEQTAVEGYEFTIVSRNNQAFRAGVVNVRAGEL